MKFGAIARRAIRSLAIRKTPFTTQVFRNEESKMVTKGARVLQKSSRFPREIGFLQQNGGFRRSLQKAKATDLPQKTVVFGHISVDELVAESRGEAGNRGSFRHAVAKTIQKSESGDESPHSKEAAWANFAAPDIYLNRSADLHTIRPTV